MVSSKPPALATNSRAASTLGVRITTGQVTRRSKTAPSQGSQGPKTGSVRGCPPPSMWEIAFTGRDHSLEKLQRTVDADRRMLLRTERTRNALTLAARHASLGNPVQMLRALCRALPYSWSSPRWWLALVKTPLRPYVPQRLVDAYRRRRGAAAL